MATKTNYEERAYKFAVRTLSKLFENCLFEHEFMNAIGQYNDTHIRKLQFASGISRIVIIRSDYVVKVDYNPDPDSWGGCRSEENLYKRACGEGMDYLLAKTTVFELRGHTFAIMPKINDTHNKKKDWYDYCNEKECMWILENIEDRHCGNYGFRNGKVCFIDYGWDAKA